jgi:hypothetical protein
VKVIGYLELDEAWGGSGYLLDWAAAGIVWRSSSEAVKRTAYFIAVLILL